MSEKVQEIIKNTVKVEEGNVEIVNSKKLSKIVDELVWEAVFGENENKLYSRWLIWEIAQGLGIYPSSINDLYMARGREELPLDFTVPAMNLRGMAYDMARAVFKTALKLDTKAMIFEIARSEMGYCDQPPAEYTTVVLAAAIKEGYKGPVFIQGDHFQTKVATPGVPKEGEVPTIKELMKEAIKYGFYNIDIDTSTLVDLDKPTVLEQQKSNISYSIEFAKHIRDIEPEGITVSLGGELGHIGGKNSTVEELEVYVEEFNKGLDDYTGMSKISVQTGTSHGGVVLEDGSLADIEVDFNVLRDTSRACRKYEIGGSVQHGASTLPDEFFSQFVKAEAVEVHLATGFQNIMMDHKKFPKGLLNDMYAWLDKEKAGDRKEGQTDEQFYYKNRKKAWGQFKKECWCIDSKIRKELRKALEKRFEFMFKQLSVTNTSKMVEEVIKPVEIKKTLEEFDLETVTKGGVKGLAD